MPCVYMMDQTKDYGRANGSGLWLEVVGNILRACYEKIRVLPYVYMSKPSLANTFVLKKWRH